MTLPRYHALCRHWARFPPLPVLLSRALSSAAEAAPVKDMASLAAFLGGPGLIRA